VCADHPAAALKIVGTMHDNEPGEAASPGGTVAELLCGEVVVSGRPCAGPAAAAVLQGAWRDQGAVGPLTVDGPFAAVVRQSGALWAYRESSGLCGLFAQATSDGRWRVASRLEAWPALTVDTDRAALHEYLRFLDIAAPRSWLRGVRAVEAGQALHLADGAQAAEELSTPPRAAALPSLKTAVDELARRLDASIAARLQDVARPGAFLSGGVDSALICAIAGRRHGASAAVTVGFDGPGFDEAPLAACIAGHLRMPHRVLRFCRADYLRAFDHLSRGMDQPMADPATMATLLAFEHCRDQFDAVLDGTGADEAVGAMPPRHVRLAVEVGSIVPAWLRRLLVRSMTPIPGLAGYTPLFDFEHPAETLMRWKGFTRAEIEELCGEPVSLEHTQFYRTFARFPRSAHYERYSALLNAMPCDRLTQAIRLTGARVRFPFCARDVDTFLRQLPTDWRHLPGQPKRILRELLARYVPREIWDVPKHSFDFPLHDFLSGDDHMLVRRHLLEGRWQTHGLLRPEVVRRYAVAFIGGDRRLMFRVWALVVLGAWLDAHEDLTTPPPRA
jgi:asparagine synthase (glutamine-hydrolysing)